MHFKKSGLPIAALSMTIGLTSCNIFNPTESVDINSDDADALTYEGYLHYRKAEYSEARKYFQKAIEADSAQSEAWFGRAKAVLNMQEHLNVFELISLSRTQSTPQSNNLFSGTANQTSGFSELSNEEAANIKQGIDSVLFFLDPFINLDTLGKTDKKITFQNFSNSYTILRLTNVGLQLRSTANGINTLFSSDSSGYHINFNAFTELGEKMKETTSDLAAAGQAMKSNPSAGAAIIKAYMPDSTQDYFTDKAYEELTIGISDLLIDLNDKVQNTQTDRWDVFYRFGNGIDDDGDGCIDEEVYDGADNDGDGEVDEDCRNNYVMKYETDPTHYNLAKMQVNHLEVIGMYNDIDIDMNGKMGKNDPDEWEFVHANSNVRNQTQNHLLKFAVTLTFNGVNKNDLIKNKELIRLDTNINNIKYNLEARKFMVGGCWNNYTEQDFYKWFLGRK